MENEKPRNTTQDAVVIALIFIVASYYLGWWLLIFGLFFILAEYYTVHIKGKK